MYHKTAMRSLHRLLYRPERSRQCMCLCIRSVHSKSYKIREMDRQEIREKKEKHPFQWML